MTASSFRSICVIGADGAGKTTVSKAIASELQYTGRDYLYWWCGWREFRSAPFRLVRAVVRSIQSESDNTEETSSDLTNPTATSSGLFWKLLGLCYFPFVFVDHFVTTVPKAVTLSWRDQPVIYDRYYYGMVIGFCAYYSFPKWLVRGLLVLSYLYPSPDAVVHLEIDPQTAYDRKDDVPSPGYIRKRCEYYDLVADRSGIVSIDAQQSPEAVKQEVIKTLESHDNE